MMLADATHAKQGWTGTDSNMTVVHDRVSSNHDRLRCLCSELGAMVLQWT